ncbi:MAG: phenylacetate--CoA ligase family protein [Nitrosomonas sp.]|nr:phenylacetate--CoA ligase family protein [Nitrosomonas sp.]
MKTIFNIRKSLYTTIISNLVFPLHEFLKNHNTVAIRNEMERTQWWSIDRLHHLQLLRLRRLLSKVQQSVPYYRKLFNQLDFDVHKVQSLSDLERLPLLDKQTIREQIESLKAEPKNKLERACTSGSSGEPLIFFLSNDRISHDVAAKWRATRWWDVDIGDPEIVIWGSPIELGVQNYVRDLRDKIFRTRLFPTKVMSPEILTKYLAEIRRIRPRMLFGYPSSIFVLARYAQSQNQKMNDLGIKVVFVTAERLYNEQSQLISTVFGCPVANGYGGRDAGFIAHTCAEGGMHITAEDMIVEIINSDGNVLPAGQSGEIVITHFFSHDFPFIRYRTGDFGILEDRQCSCGRNLPLLKEIQGRSNDFLVAANGVMMHEVDFTSILRNQPQIKYFKIVQEALEQVHIYIVSKPDLDQSLLQQIEQTFKTRLGQTVNIVIRQVAEIPAERSGKFRYVVSKVANR